MSFLALLSLLSQEYLVVAFRLPLQQLCPSPRESRPITRWWATLDKRYPMMSHTAHANCDRCEDLRSFCHTSYTLSAQVDVRFMELVFYLGEHYGWHRSPKHH